MRVERIRKHIRVGATFFFLKSRLKVPVRNHELKINAISESIGITSER